MPLHGDRRISSRVLPGASLAIALLGCLSAIPCPAAASSSQARSTPASFSLLDAPEHGVFNIGPGQGQLTRAADEALGREVLTFQYSVPKGSIIGVWTRGYAHHVNVQTVDAIRIGVHLPPDQVQQVAVKVEIKGTKAVQTIPLHLEPGWNSFRDFIHWNAIGELREGVVVVSPIGGGPVTEGTVSLDLEFYRATVLQQHAVFVNVGLVIAISVLLAWMAALLGALSGRRRTGGTWELTRQLRSRRGAPDAAVRAPLKQDLLYGLVAVLMIGAAAALYTLGASSPLETGVSWECLAIAAAGAAIAELLKVGLTGGHLTPREVFVNTLVTGFLATAASSQELLQVPSSWMQLLMVNRHLAVIAFVAYHLTNARALVSTGRHSRAITAALIGGAPYLLNWVVLLQDVSLLHGLSRAITGGLFAGRPAVLTLLGQLLVLFGFNEAVANGISLATTEKPLQAPRTHLFVLLVSLNAVVSPLVADVGSTAWVAALPGGPRALVAVLTSALSHAGLWGEMYLITGLVLDGIHRIPPSRDTIGGHVLTGMRKGMAYSGILMALLFALHLLLGSPALQAAMAAAPLVAGTVGGALLFPLAKTIIETFDGSQPFADRLRYSCRDWTLSARGAVVGAGFALMVTHALFREGTSSRIASGLLIGLLASAGISLFRDAVYASGRQGRIQSWRLYAVDALLGGFVGSAAAFYLDAAQVPVVIEKFTLYTSAGVPAVDYVTYPLVSKWGRIDLGSYTGGVKLLFLEALAGVLNWAVAAWLFAMNRVFLEAWFQRDRSPIRFFFSKAGFVELIKHMIHVLRWGLWMSPIIFTFLRMMPEPTWYNQDGAIRTLAALYHHLTASPEAFRAWSLNVFVGVLAFDLFRVLIWMDHMGLRVATLVNLSFIGMDKLDERAARFIGHAASQRYIPEAVKRFTTWAPLLIPFYLPRGQDWDYAWSTSEALRNSASARGDLVATFVKSLSLPQALGLAAAALAAWMGLWTLLRLVSRRPGRRREASCELGNRAYRVTLKDTGELSSEVVRTAHDVSRRSYDLIDPCGRVLYIVDTDQRPDRDSRFWPVIGNFPSERFTPSRLLHCQGALKVVNTAHGVRTTIEIVLPDAETPAELWTVTVENLTDRPRRLKVIPYLEWVLNRAADDRFHTQYARLFPEVEYVGGGNAVLAWHKATKALGLLASDVPPEGFLTSRVDFIGRARSIWSPRILETLAFLPPRDTAPHPTFDPVGSLVLPAAVGPRASKTLHLLIGSTSARETALALINTHLKPRRSLAAPAGEERGRSPRIGHGEVPPGTPQPYFTWLDHGRRLLVRTPYTPRPVDHTLANAAGHSVMVTNRGLHTSCNGNAQQNRLTPDWSDTVTQEIPGEAIYLYDPERDEWYAPTHHPLNDPQARHEAEFSVEGTAVFRMTRGSLATELTVFVPPEDPVGVYLLTVKNQEDRPRRLRVAPYFQLVLSFQPERSGPLQVRVHRGLNAILFENPRNTFRQGPAFAATSLPAERVEVKRGRFFGDGRGVTRPFFVERGRPDPASVSDDRPIAGFLGTLEIPAHGERTIVILLGQTDRRDQAVRVIQRYRTVEAAQAGLEETTRWWRTLLGAIEVETDQPAFDRLHHWLKYQTLVERLWARRGFYQTSGAFGFRDQLQDAVNLIWLDPDLARRQILLHASHQFLEGDVFHWFFTLQDGRTGFACRSHASDNHLWLVWAVVEYVRATGDASILQEMTSYVTSDTPFHPLPRNKHGLGGLYHRSTRADTVYGHCMRSIDLVLDRRMGAHGLPLIGTGDWNDGLDAIGSEGRGESVWLGFFLHCLLKGMLEVIGRQEGPARREHYRRKLQELETALERTWRGDRYLRAIHDDGTEIGVKDSGVWEIDALTAAWAVMSGVNPERGRIVFQTALRILEQDQVILLGWPALREDTKPYLGRSSKYPEGVRENGMYCHGVQWLIRAARLLAEQCEGQGDRMNASGYRRIAYRLFLKISPIPHATPKTIELYGGQPNKQPADLLTAIEPGRMIWHGYTGAAGWLFREALEGVIGASLVNGQLILPPDLHEPRGDLRIRSVGRRAGATPPAASNSSVNGWNWGWRGRGAGRGRRPSLAGTGRLPRRMHGGPQRV